jgi:DNA polymerase elongation subunit (family B)
MCDGCDFTTDRTKEHLLHHIRNNYPTIIGYSDIDLLPSRNDLLNQELIKCVDMDIEENKPILFLPNSVSEPMMWRYGKRSYSPYIFGIMPCGRKTAIILENIPIFFDIKLPDAPALMCETHTTTISMKNEAFIEEVKTALLVQNTPALRSEIKYMFPASGFSLVEHPYLRLFFNNLPDRANSITSLRSTYPDCPTSSDDLVGGARMSGLYFLKVAREYKFNTADWNIITKYRKLDASMRIPMTNCDAYVVNVNDYKPLLAETRATYEYVGKSFDYDHTIVMQWDIETNGEIPDITPTAGQYEKHFNTDKITVFMMNSSYYYHWNTKHIMSVCCVDGDLLLNKQTETSTPNDLITIVCGNEYNVLSAHTQVMALMKPDITSAFNGASFDTPIYREKLYNYGILGELKRALHMIVELEKYYEKENVYRYSFEYNKKIKLAADRDHISVCAFNFAGVIDTDVMLSFLKLYPRAEISKAASLNFFLKDNDLDSKEDMDYIRMFRIHDRSVALRDANKKCHCDSKEPCKVCDTHIKNIDYIEDTRYTLDDPRRFTDKLHEGLDDCCACAKRPRNLADMELVAIYCRIDCQRPQELNVKRAIITDKRELANISFVPLYNAFYRADGEKVRNMMAAYCNVYNVAFSSINLQKGDHEKDWNTGGFVVTPKRGLYKTPMTGLDFASLYPSLIGTYNLSPDMIVDNAEFAEFLRARGYTLHPIVDESGEYLQFTRGSKKGSADNETIRTTAWSVRHNGILSSADTNIVEGYDENYKPIYGRKALQHESMGYMAYIVKMLKEVRNPIKHALGMIGKNIEKLELKLASCAKDSAEYRELTVEIADNEFQQAKTTSKSSSVKVLNNTFYGQVASFRNSFYNINIAGGITAAGRRNLMFVKQYVESRGFFIAYGDTDSLYITCPDYMFDELRAKFGVVGDDIPTEEYYKEMVALGMEIMTALARDVYRELVKNNGTTFLVMEYEEVGLPAVLCGKKKYYMIPHLKVPNFNVKAPFIRGLELKKQGQTIVSKELQMKYLWATLSIKHNRTLIDVAEEIIKEFFITDLDARNFAKMYTYRPHKRNISVLKFVERMRIRGAKLPDAGDKFKCVVVNKKQEYTIRGTKIAQSVGDKMEYLYDFLDKEGTTDAMTLDLNYYLDAGIYGAFARFIAYYPDFQMSGLDMTDPVQYKIGDKYSVAQAYKYLELICSKYIITDDTGRELGKQMKRDFTLASKTINYGYDGSIKRALANRSGGILATKGDITHPIKYIEKMRENIKQTHTKDFAVRFVAKYTDMFKLKREFDFRARNNSLKRLEFDVTNELLRILPDSWRISDDYKQRINDAVKAGNTEVIELSGDDLVVIARVEALISRFRAIIICIANIFAIIKHISEEIVRKADIEYIPRINARELSITESKCVSNIAEYEFQ